MGVSIEEWRTRIGQFSMPRMRDHSLRQDCPNRVTQTMSLSLRIVLFLLLAAECIEMNPGPTGGAKGGNSGQKLKTSARKDRGPNRGTTQTDNCDPHTSFGCNRPTPSELDQLYQSSQSHSILEPRRSSRKPVQQPTIGDMFAGSSSSRKNRKRSESASTRPSYTDDEFLTSDERTDRTNTSALPAEILLDIQKCVKRLDTKFDRMELSLQTLKDENNQLKQRNAELFEKVGNLQTQVGELSAKYDNLEGQSRRENLRFFNMKEETRETWEETETKVRTYIKDELGIESENIQIERAHRLLGKYKPRPVIVKFSFYKDKNKILRKYKDKVKTERENGTLRSDEETVRISEDFPENVRRIQKLLIPFMKDAIESGKRAYLRFDKLVIDGATYVYREETQDIGRMSDRQ